MSTSASNGSFERPSGTRLSELGEVQHHETHGCPHDGTLAPSAASLEQRSVTRISEMSAGHWRAVCASLCNAHSGSFMDSNALTRTSVRDIAPIDTRTNSGETT